DQDRQRRLARADVAQHLEPGSPRQHQVQDDGVVVECVGLLAGVAAVMQDIDRVALPGQPVVNEAGDLAIVLNNKYPHYYLSSALSLRPIPGPIPRPFVLGPTVVAPSY